MTEATWFIMGVAGLAIWSAIVAISEFKTAASASGHGSEPMSSNFAR